MLMEKLNSKKRVSNRGENYRGWWERLAKQ